MSRKFEKHWPTMLDLTFMCTCSITMKTKHRQVSFEWQVGVWHRTLLGPNRTSHWESKDRSRVLTALEGQRHTYFIICL
jgi:hypothetical protein